MALTPEQERAERLRKMGELAELAYEHDPDAKASLDRFAESQAPGVKARVAAERAVTAAQQKIDAKIAEFDLKEQQREAARRREESIAAIKANPELRIRDEDLPEVEKHMLARGIGNYEDGAHSWRRMNTIAAPVSARNLTMDVPGLDPEMPGLEWMKGIITEGGVNKGLLDRRAKQEAQRIVSDFANGRGDQYKQYA